jgi:NAD(P)-dependent dehydrogenase (short-subunit alcohol dehydrogenase family)
MTMDLQLAGKTVLITGGSKGIGQATAEVLAEEGCNLILVARNADLLDAAAAGIRAKRKVNVRTIAADLSSDQSVHKVALEAGELDILVNNAGAIPPGDLLSIDDARWRQAWDLKVFGYISFCRVVYAQMKARQAGVIINIIGAAGESFPTGYIAGAAGNASLMAFTRALGKGAPADGLRVVAINPGPVETDRLVMLRRAEAQAKFGDPERWRELTANMPFGRAATPKEIGSAVAFLASSLSGYTTGTVLTINGGG